MKDTRSPTRDLGALEEPHLHGPHVADNPCIVHPFRARSNIGAEQTETHLIDVELAAGIVGEVLKPQPHLDLAGCLHEAQSKPPDVQAKCPREERRAVKERPDRSRRRPFSPPCEGRSRQKGIGGEQDASTPEAPPHGGADLWGTNAAEDRGREPSDNRGFVRRCADGQRHQKVTTARAPAMNSLRSVWMGSLGSGTPPPGLITYCRSGWTTSHPVTCAW